MEVLNSWWTWLVGLGAAGGIALWVFGFAGVISAVARILASLIEIATPLLKSAVEGIVWFWQSVLFPGLRLIFGTWVTTITMLVLCGLVWTTTRIPGYFEERELLGYLRTCQADLKKARGKNSKVQLDPVIWPLNLWFK